MSRIGLNKRLRVVRDTLFPPGSFAWRLQQLRPAELELYTDWRDRCGQWYAKIETEHGPGAAFERYLEAADLGDSVAFEPPELMPLALRWKLFPEPPPRSGDPQADYLEMIRDD